MDKLLGTQVGQYQIEALVSSGAIGTVYQAMDTQEGKPVCLKQIHPSLAKNHTFRQRLQETSGHLERLRHKFIVRFHQLLEQGDQLFLVTDWVQGETLGQLSRRAPINLSLAVNLVGQTASVLADAHRQGVVHGNIHPNNLLLKADVGESPWRVIVSDFLFTSLPEGQPLNENLPYVAPEIADGKRVDGRSDIYALGILLFSLATGRPPFAPTQLYEIGGLDVPSPRAWAPEIPEGLERVILKATARKITDRYRSMEEFALALRRDIGNLPQNAAATQFANVPAAAPTPPPPVAAAPRPAFTPTPGQVISSEMGVIKISTPGEQPNYFPLKKWLVTIGQMPNNDIVLPGQNVADIHARLEYRKESGWSVVDVSIHYGTTLEDSRLLPDMPQPIEAGQKIHIGEYVLEWYPSIMVPDDALPYATPDEKQAQKPVTPPKPQGLLLSLSRARVTVMPGSLAGQELVMENLSKRTVYVTLGVGGIPSEWVVMEDKPIRLVPQQRVMVPISFEPPRNSSAVAGSHSYQITAVSPDGVESEGGQATLTVAPFNQFLVELQPSTMRHRKTGQVILTNDGNTADRYVLTAEDSAREAIFELPTSAVELAPGAAQSFSIRATGRKQMPILVTKVLPFELRVKSEEKSNSTRGLVVVPPLIPLKTIFALLALSLLAVLLWFGYRQCTQDPEFLGGVCSGAEVVPTVTVVAEVATVPPTEVIVVAATETAVPVTPTPGEVVPPAPDNREVIGLSVEGQPIEAFRFGNGANVIIFVGGIHFGYAPSSVRLADETIEYFTANSSAVPPGATLYIVRNLNPDATEAPGEKEGRFNANGVDLNRNWDCRWQPDAYVVDGYLPGSGGSERHSEPETVALRDFIAQKQPVVVVVWDATVSNQGVVSPGQCAVDQAGDETTPSESLAQVYAGAVGYAARQANPDLKFTGDVTDSLADQGVPAVFVLLDSFSRAPLQEQLPGIEAVLQEHGE